MRKDLNSRKGVREGYRRARSEEGRRTQVREEGKESVMRKRYIIKTEK